MTVDLFLIPLIKIVIILGLILTTVILLVYAERRVSAFIQGRYGPNRVGPFGLFQPIADVIKLILKEDIVPKAASKIFHSLAPIISLTVALVTLAVVPFGGTVYIFGKEISLMVAPGVNIGILYILAMSSLGVYGITLSGWSSNNKYSLLGGLRATAQMISYEISMGLAIIGIIMVTGSLQLENIVSLQEGWKWNFIFQPIGFITFMIAAFAETNRLPFDLPEAEAELVGGFHTEYSGLKFGMFFLAEYANMITSAALITTLYLGGYRIPYIETMGISQNLLGLISFITFYAKVTFILLFMIWVRWTLPRFRYDQLMNLGWKVMLPLGLLNIFLTGLGLMLFKR
jgi:NADH-quinone oxidoreductase subunit H